MSVIHVTSQNFSEVVLNATAPVLMDFSATWCGPCARMAPILEEFAAEHPEFTVCKIDVDEAPDLASAYGVESIPTLIAVKDGKLIARTVGVQPKAALLALFH